MKEKFEAPGRDAVLNERKRSKPYLFHHRRLTHDVWWENLFRYVRLSRWLPNIDIHSISRSKFDESSERSDLMSTFNQLKDCCEDSDTDLRAAIRYGLTVLFPSGDSKGNSKSDDLAASVDASNIDANASHHNRH